MYVFSIALYLFMISHYINSDHNFLYPPSSGYAPRTPHLVTPDRSLSF